MGTSSPTQGTHPQFSAHVGRGQTVGWSRMPLGTEVGLGPGDIIFRWGSSSPKTGTTAMDQAATWRHCFRRGPRSPKRSTAAPTLWPMSIVAIWLDGSRCHLVRRYNSPRPRPHCIRWGPSSPHRKGHSTPPPLFGSCYCGKTVAHLSNC